MFSPARLPMSPIRSDTDLADLSETSANYSLSFINNTYSWISTSYRRNESYADAWTPTKYSTLPHPAININIYSLTPSQTSNRNNIYFFEKLILCGNKFETNHGWTRFFRVNLYPYPKFSILDGAVPFATPQDYYHESIDNSQIILKGNLVNISDNSVIVRYFDDAKKAWFWYEHGARDVDLLGLNLRQLFSCKLFLFQRNVVDAREFATFDYRLSRLNVISLGSYMGRNVRNPYRTYNRFNTFLVDSGDIIMADNDFYFHPGSRSIEDFKNVIGEVSTVEESQPDYVPRSIYFYLTNSTEIEFFESSINGFHIVQPRDVNSIRIFNNKVRFQGTSGGCGINIVIGMDGSELDGADSRASSGTAASKATKSQNIAYRAKHRDQKKNIGLISFENNTFVSRDGFEMYGLHMHITTYFEYFGDVLFSKNTVDFVFDLNHSKNYPDIQTYVKSYVARIFAYNCQTRFDIASFQFVNNHSFIDNNIHLSGGGWTHGAQYFGDESNFTSIVVARNVFRLNQSDFDRLYTMDDMKNLVAREGINNERRISASFAFRIAKSAGDTKYIAVHDNTIDMNVSIAGEGGCIGITSETPPQRQVVTYFFWDAHVFNNTIRVLKTKSMPYEAHFTGILVMNYEETENIRFGFVKIYNNFVNMTSTSEIAISGFNAISVNSQYLNEQTMNSVIIENNTLISRAVNRTISSILLSSSERVAADMATLTVRAVSGDSRMISIIIRNNNLRVVNERGSASAIGFVGAGVAQIDRLEIYDNNAEVVSLSSSTKLSESVQDGVNFVCFFGPYGETYLYVNPTTSLLLPILTEGGLNMKFHRLIAKNNTIFLSNHFDISRDIFPASWFDYKKELISLKPPSCTYMRVLAGIVVINDDDDSSDSDSSSSSNNLKSMIRILSETVIISMLPSLHPQPTGFIFDPILSYEETSVATGYTFVNSNVSHLEVTDFVVNVTEHRHCIPSTSFTSFVTTTTSSFSNGFFFSLRRGSVLAKWSNTPLTINFDHLELNNISANYEIRNEREALNYCFTSSADSQSSSSTGSSFTTDFIKLSDISQITSFSRINITDSRVQVLENKDNKLLQSSFTSLNIFSSPSALSFPGKNKFFDVDCFRYNDQHTFQNSDIIKSAVPLLKGLSVTPCNGAVLSRTTTLTDESSASKEQTNTKSQQTASATNSEEMLIENYVVSESAQNAVRLGQSAALIANLVSSNPTLLLSVARSSAMTALALCTVNAKDLTPAQRQKKFENFSSFVLSRELNFPETLLPDIGIGSEKLGAHHRAGILGFILAIVVCVLAALYEGTINKSKWKEYCLRNSNARSHQYSDKISFFEYAHLDKFILKPILFVSPFLASLCGILATGESGKAGDVVFAIVPLVIIVVVVILFGYKVKKFVFMKQGEIEIDKRIKIAKSKRRGKKLPEKKEQQFQDERDALPDIPLHFIDSSDIFYPRNSKTSSWKAKIRTFLRSKAGRILMLGDVIWNSGAKFADFSKGSTLAGPGIETQMSSLFRTYQGPLRTERTKEEMEIAESENEMLLMMDDKDDHHMITNNNNNNKNTLNKQSLAAAMMSSSPREQSTSSSGNERSLIKNTNKKMDTNKKSSNAPPPRLMSPRSTAKHKYDFSIRRKLQPMWIMITLINTIVISLLSGISTVLPETCETHFFVVTILIIADFLTLLWLRSYIVLLRLISPLMIEFFTIVSSFIFLNLILADSGGNSSSINNDQKNDEGQLSSLNQNVDYQAQIAIALSSYPGSVIGLIAAIFCGGRVVFLKLSNCIILIKDVIRDNLREELKELEEELLPVDVRARARLRTKKPEEAVSLSPRREEQIIVVAKPDEKPSTRHRSYSPPSNNKRQKR